MATYVCELCGYEYDPKEGDVDHGIERGVEFEDLPDTFVCPLCGAAKEDFEKVKGDFDTEDDENE